MAVGNYIFTDGGSEFNHYYIQARWLQILAANASIWAPLESENLRGAGFLLQVDHLNATTGVKYTRVLNCSRMPQDKMEADEKCKLLTAKVRLIFCNL